MDMRLYQPVLFVGLGGTGCRIGVEFERRLRAAVCGPDGRAFAAQRGRGGMLPYQLPNCFQFVYVDTNEAELGRLQGDVVPGPEHEKAVPYTAQYVTGLMPDFDSYPRLAMNLRMKASAVTRDWLPPKTEDEPPVAPLQRGAGQFPTIGRAALYGTFLNGVGPATRQLDAAIGRLSGSGADLRAMSSDQQQLEGIDVFVAFSVVGGTGAGIFYDYLHLISDTIKKAAPSLRVQIYPLVLMPSAFTDGIGGGRKAELNAARALLDLFRLVDAQNRANPRSELVSQFDLPDDAEDDVSVTYPGGARIEVPAGQIQTGFLFNRPTGAKTEDLYASVVSLVMSLIATGMTDQERQSADRPMSFAEAFVNEVANRAELAPNQIGSRSVSTASVATFSVPVEELAGIVASRLLREAIKSMAEPDTAIESNQENITNFLIRANVYPVVQQRAAPPREPGQEQGAKNITAALDDRRKAMQVGLDSLRSELVRDMPTTAKNFNPREGLTDLLGAHDPFRAERVISGYGAFEDTVNKDGARGVLLRRRQPPPAPAGIGVAAPEIPALKDKTFPSFRKVKWNDDEVVAVRAQQQRWYEWQARGIWAAAWDKFNRQWQPSLKTVETELRGLTDALRAFAGQDDFSARSEELYRERVGVTYLLPEGGMEHFYTSVLRELPTRRTESGKVGMGSDEAELLAELIDDNTWRTVFDKTLNEPPGRAISYLLEQVTVAVEEFLRDDASEGETILPRLHDLLAQAATGSAAAGRAAIDADYVRQFQRDLGGMLPANFAPQGSQKLRVLISYPAEAKNPRIEEYLQRAVNLSREHVTPEYRAAATESITAVLHRTSMGLTEVGEVRDVLRNWASALARPQPLDLPRWRQRTGYDFGYLATREGDRVRILHRMLCAMWNGNAAALGDQDSPRRFNIKLDGEVTMTLPLTPLRDSSSWGSLLTSYELWALDDNPLHAGFCEELMRVLPTGIDSRPELPAELYVKFRKMAAGQISELDRLLKRQSGEQRTRTEQMLAFWKRTVPAALNHNFTGVPSPVDKNLISLEESLELGLGGIEPEGETTGSEAD
jgi:hypothetical protein